MPDLVEQIRQLVDESAPPVTWLEIRQKHSRVEHLAPTLERSPLRAPGRRPVRPFGVIAAALLIVAAVSAGLVLSRQVSSVRRGARPTTAPRAATWRLTADLQGPQFGLATGTPGAVIGVTCSGGPTCFLSTAYGIGGASGVTGSTYVSHDSGKTWQSSTLPSGVATTTLVSCASPTWCAAGGGLVDPTTGDPAAKKVMRDPELLTTTDGGSTWKMNPVPIPPYVEQLPPYGDLPAETTLWPGIVDAVACSEPGVCTVLGHVQRAIPSGSGSDELVALRTTDGGATWTSTVLPERSSETGDQLPMYGIDGSPMACPTTTDCVVVVSFAGPGPGAAADAWRTTDGGRTWLEHQLPAAVLTNVSCPTVDDCWAGPSSGVVLHSVDGGDAWTSVPLPGVLANGPFASMSGPQGDALSCPSADTCFVGGGADIVETQDGGQTWQGASLPSGVARIVSISCNAEQVCVAVASPSATVNIANEGSMVLTDTPVGQ